MVVKRSRKKNKRFTTFRTFLILGASVHEDKPVASLRHVREGVRHNSHFQDPDLFAIQLLATDSNHLIVVRNMYNGPMFGV